MAARQGGGYRRRMRPRFGELLRTWRQARKRSQLDVAIAADISARHLSFLETGRSQPSREMVVLLAEVLDVPLRERNALLDAAGFAHRYRESGLDAPEMAPVRRSLAFLLERHEPYPAIVCNRRWDLLLANQAATRMVAHFVAPGARALAAPPNVMRLLFAPDGFRPHVVNWRELASVMVQRLHREALAHADDDARALLDLALTSDVPADWRAPDLELAPSPIVPMHVKKGDLELRLFSALTTLGTAVDVTAHECRLETFFPADEATEQALRRLAAPS
jgi:transcriptional regulator with XRE-family HTH domain